MCAYLFNRAGRALDASTGPRFSTCVLSEIIMREKIPGGYYLKPRKIEDSDMAHKPPAVREIWDLLIRKANFRDGYKNGLYLLRGQHLIPSYQTIRDELCWYAGASRRSYSESAVKRAMKELRTTGRITTRKAPKGIIITICNYCFFQSPDNYERTNEHTAEEPPNELGANCERTGTQSKPTNAKDSSKSHKNEKKKKNDNSIEVDIYDFYLQEITPKEKTKHRALSNITNHLKCHSADDLKQAILNYKTVTAGRAPQYRKNPANFFGKQEPAFVDYLPGNFESEGEPQQPESQRPQFFSVSDPEAVEELFKNG